VWQQMHMLLLETLMIMSDTSEKRTDELKLD
jgi:hypothetical protein